jgi:DNA-binding PadR family transcriptional regulator
MPALKQPFTVELALLGLVRTQAAHPYELHQRLRESRDLGLVWQIKQAHLYALLARLEAAGYLISIPEPQANRPPRKMLHLTEQGRAVFAHWLHEPVAHGRDFRLEFLAKLFFAHQEGPATVAALIERQRDACRRRMRDLDRQIAALPADQPFERLVVQFRSGQLAATLAWLDSCAQALLPAQTER